MCFLQIAQHFTASFAREMTSPDMPALRRRLVKSQQQFFWLFRFPLVPLMLEVVVKLVADCSLVESEPKLHEVGLQILLLLVVDLVQLTHKLAASMLRHLFHQVELELKVVQEACPPSSS